MLSSTVALFSLALPALVSAHGFVSQVTIDGKSYKGLSPYQGGGKSVIRQISGVEPVKGTWNPDLACGLKSKPASDSAKASPGSTISFKWSGGGNSNWPHEYGPLITYMADCNGPCEEFNAANAKWFKIDQVGKTSGNRWAQKDLMSGAPATVKIPSDLASGNYLIRHEIIALHIAENSGGAEFYPSCTQLKVEGNGWAKPDKTISLPGAYKENDKGLLIHVWTAKGDYVFPGGALAKLGGGGSDSSSGGGDAPAPSKSKDAAPSSSKSPKPTSSKGSDGDWSPTSSAAPTSSKGSDNARPPSSSATRTSSKGSDGEWSPSSSATPTSSKGPKDSSSSPVPTSSKDSGKGPNNAAPSSSKDAPEWTKDWSPTSSSSSSTPTPSKNPDKGSNGGPGFIGQQGSIPQGDSDKPSKDDSEKPPKGDSEKPKDNDKPKDDDKSKDDSDKPVKMPVRQRPCRPATRRSLRTARHRLSKMH